MSSDEKSVIVGDDPIDNVSQDWYGFDPHVQKLADFLYDISKTSSVCCGLLGEWGTGKTSFLRLMRKYIQSKTEWKAEDIWFVAWDPGGIESLGDAILYHIYARIAKVAESDSSEEGKALRTAYDGVKRSIGIRKGIRDRITGISEKLGEIESVPIVKDVATLANIAIGQFTSGQVLRTSVQTLCEYIEKKEITVFLFIDELDRASGEQILSILSELKAYLNHRRIVIVLGYDEAYVHNALSSQVLPVGTDVNEYIKKIITLRKNIPNPTIEQLRDFSDTILKRYLSSNDEANIKRLSSVATQLCDYNPRKLKRLILSFLQHKPIEDLGIWGLVSLLITTALDEEGFLSRRDVTESFDSQGSDKIHQVLSEITDLEHFASLRVLKNALKEFPSVFFQTRVIKYLGIPQHGAQRQIQEQERESSAYSWRTSFLPIIQSVSKIQPKIPGHLVYQDNDFQLSELVPLADIPDTWDSIMEFISNEVKSFFLTSSDYHLLILLSSNFGDRASLSSLLYRLYYSSPVITLEKPMVIWLIDDKGTEKVQLDNYMKTSKLHSKGLKNYLTLLITRPDQINELFFYLISVISSENPK